MSPRSATRSMRSSPSTNLPRKGIRIGIGTNRVGVRALDVEGIEDPKQLGNAVRFRAHEALSIPMDQAVLDYHVVSETADESGGITRRVVLAAAYREPVDHFVAACQAGGLELMGIDVEAFALLRAVAPTARRRTTPATRDRRCLARSRPLDPCDLRRNDLRFHARARMGRREDRDGHRPRSRADRRRGLRAEARALAARGRPDPDEDPRHDARTSQRAPRTDSARA